MRLRHACSLIPRVICRVRSLCSRAAVLLCLFFVAVQAAFQQAVADIDHAIQRLETGLQNGLYLPTMSSLWGLQEVTARMYKACMRVHHKHFMPVVWLQVGHSVYAVGEYPPEILARATEIVNRSMWSEFPAKGLALMYACRGERLSSFVAWV